MKLLVFAHTPPPHHGQSQMIAHLVEGFGGVQGSESPKLSHHGIEVFHVNAQLSDDLEDVGAARAGKIPRLIRYCAQALSLRFRRGVRTFYYVPSPPKRSSLYRDWIVMVLCRPFFQHLILHWHSVGLGEWLETSARPWERWITRCLLGRATLSIVLSHYNESDAARLNPRRIAVVANGIPDPCPGGAPAPAPVPPTPATADTARTIRVLFLALCTRDKGLHDAVRGVLIANDRVAAAGQPLRFQLSVAGAFVTEEERKEFDTLCASPGASPAVRHLGFLDREAKLAQFRAADLFCFPTYYANEGQPLNLIEAMAFGIPAVTTRWRAIPELYPADEPGLVEPRAPEQVAEALIRLATAPRGPAPRRRFEQRFTLERHLEALAAALRSVES